MTRKAKRKNKWANRVARQMERVILGPQVPEWRRCIDEGTALTEQQLAEMNAAIRLGLYDPQS